jgi:hypothetical protein
MGHRFPAGILLERVFPESLQAAFRDHVRLTVKMAQIP